MNDPTWYVRAGSLIDGVARQPIVDAGVRIEGETVAWAGPWAEVGAEIEGREHLDLRGYTVMPGLIDAHTHMTLFGDGRSYEETAAQPDEVMLLAAAHNVHRHLLAGVTTARDNGARNSTSLIVRDAIRQGVIPGPRLLVSGPPVTKRRGHFHWCNGEADDETEVRALVSRLIDRSVDHIKIMASGGGTIGTDPRAASYSVSELRAAVDVAGDRGRLTTAHCRALESMNRALAAGVDCMEHAQFLQPDGEMRFDEATAERLGDSDMYISPTLSAWHWDTILRLRGRRDEGVATEEELALLARREADVSKVLENFSLMLEAGLGPRIIGGTDAGCADVSFGHLDYAMDLMVQGGMSEMDVIRSCTSVAAEAIGMKGQVGSLAKGAQADLIVVDGDPSRSIHAMSRVKAVCFGGRWVRADLAELAGAAAPA